MLYLLRLNKGFARSLTITPHGVDPAACPFHGHAGAFSKTFSFLLEKAIEPSRNSFCFLNQQKRVRLSVKHVRLSR